MNKNNNKKGFTLIEVLIGLVLLAIGLLAIAGMQITSVRGNFFSKNLSEASVLAQDRLEELRNRPFGSAELTVGNHNDGTIAGTIFSRDYNVSILPGTTMLSVVVNVRWRDTTDHNISFSTVRSQ